MSYVEINFHSGGDICSGWHFPATDTRLESTRGRPVVVMGHGFGGTKDSGLQDFADWISRAGVDVLAFDYRGFGASGGTPRQSISMTRQVEDFHSAINAAKEIPGIDRDRVAVWGSSMSGAHVIRVAADRSDVTGVIAMTPLTSGIAAGIASVRARGPLSPVPSMAKGIASRIAQRRGRPPVMIPLVSAPNGSGLLALSGAYESYTSIAGPTWRNEVDAGVGFEMGPLRVTPDAKRLRSRLLVQIAEFDRYVPAQSVAKTAVAGRAVVHHYPCDHFDVWPGHEWFERVASDQVRFLTRVFGEAVSTGTDAAATTTTT